MNETASELKKFVSFNAVGLVTTAVGVPFIVLLDWMGVPYGVYTTLNSVLGMILGFWLNFRYTFSQDPLLRWTTLGRYGIAFLLLLLAVQGLQYGLIDVLGWPRWLGVGAGMMVYAGLGYFVSRVWVFRHARMP